MRFIDQLNAEGRNLTNKTRVLILGGGLGGLYAALHLDKTIACDQDIEVTLVSRESFVLFAPMLAEEATGKIPSNHSAQRNAEAIKEVERILKTYR